MEGQSTEIEAALKRFEDVCNSLEDQHTKLIDLEKRRKKLNEDLQSLRDEIKDENNHFRSVVDNNIVGDGLEVVEDEGFGAMVEPATLDTVAIKEFIKNQKDELSSPEDEMHSCLQEVKYRLKVPVKPVRQHVDEKKCIITEISNNEDVQVQYSKIPDLQYHGDPK